MRVEIQRKKEHKADESIRVRAFEGNTKSWKKNRFARKLNGKKETKLIKNEIQYKSFSEICLRISSISLPNPDYKKGVENKNMTSYILAASCNTIIQILFDSVQSSNRRYNRLFRLCGQYQNAYRCPHLRVSR